MTSQRSTEWLNVKEAELTNTKVRTKEMIRVQIKWAIINGILYGPYSTVRKNSDPQNLQIHVWKAVISVDSGFIITTMIFQIILNLHKTSSLVCLCCHYGLLGVEIIINSTQACDIDGEQLRRGGWLLSGSSLNHWDSQLLPGPNLKNFILLFAPF